MSGNGGSRAEKPRCDVPQEVGVKSQYEAELSNQRRGSGLRTSGYSSVPHGGAEWWRYTAFCRPLNLLHWYFENVKYIILKTQKKRRLEETNREVIMLSNTMYEHLSCHTPTNNIAGVQSGSEMRGRRPTLGWEEGVGPLPMLRNSRVWVST